MTAPTIPPENGKKVTSRSISWQDQCVRAWGAEWNKPDIGYRFSDSITKDNTDRYETGIYRRT